MSECIDCGGPASKNAAGHYRDKCDDCVGRPDDAPRHVDTCDRPDCVVCASHGSERRPSAAVQVIQELLA